MLECGGDVAWGNDRQALRRLRMREKEEEEEGESGMVREGQKWAKVEFEASKQVVRGGRVGDRRFTAANRSRG